MLRNRFNQRPEAWLIFSLVFASMSLGNLYPTPAQALETPASDIKHPDWSYSASIYEVNVRQYTSEGTFDAFAHHLPRLKGMGVSILWFMPIHPIGQLKRKGTLGSYYSVKDYKDVNPEFGTIDDFKNLVKRIHEMGMYVIIDWVGNHCAWDNPLVRQHPDWFTHDAQGNLVSPVPEWSDVVDFDYSRPDLWNFMIEAMKFWVRDVGVDGFRCDVAGMVPLEFWERARQELEEIKPVFMLAEWEAPQAHFRAFDATYGWDLYHLMMKVAKGSMPASAIGNYLEVNSRSYPQDAYRMYFTSNHDENSWNGSALERFGAGAPVFAILSLTLDGIPLVYGGQEAGLNKRLAFFDKDEIPWAEHPIREIYRRLLLLKRANRALWNGEQGARAQWIHTSDDDHVFAFVRRKSGDKVLVVTNLSNSDVEVTLKGKSHVGGYRQILPKDLHADIYFMGDDKIHLPPWGYRVFAEPVDEGFRGLERASRGLDVLSKILPGLYASRGALLDDTSQVTSTLEIIHVWKESQDGEWFYIEDKIPNDNQKLQARYLWHLFPRADGIVIGRTFAISRGLTAGNVEESFWKNTSRDALSLVEGCTLAFRRKKVGVFTAQLEDSACLYEDALDFPLISGLKVKPGEVKLERATARIADGQPIFEQATYVRQPE